MTATERLGRYRVGQRIGEGGTSEVFLGHVDGAEGFSKTVAIKRLRGALAADAAMREALVAEAAVARRLEHGNIVQVLDVGTDGEQPYLVVEYVEGVTLAEVMADSRRIGRPVALADALYVIEELLAALEYAHGLGDPVVHRDVKPGNLLLSRDGVVKLGDFGLARPVTAVSTTLPGVVKGTLGYLSPEQARGETVGAASDQFSAGVVLHELCAGFNPLEQAGSLAEYVGLLEAGLPVLATGDEVDDELAAIVARAVSVDPRERYPTVAELRHQLASWRVSRDMRTGAAGIRQAVRTLLGEASTGRSLRLDEALGAELEARPDAATNVAMQPARRPSRVWPWIAVAVLAGLAAVVFGIMGGDDHAAEPAPIPAVTPDARPVAADAAAPVDAGPVVFDAAIARRLPAPPKPQPAARGRLTVNTIPWANVTLDGRSLGRTPVDEPVRAGRHVLILHNPDLDRRVQMSIEVPAGETLAVKSWTP